LLADALLLQLGYNATLVTIGAMLLGMAAGLGGTFLFLRKRALVSDAISHATLPGIGLAFLVMTLLGGDGRGLPGLLLGAMLSAALGLLAVQWLTRRTRLGEDAAIGAVLSVFFGFGVVLLTAIQTLSLGQQAGLEGFLLGSTAGMLSGEAAMLAVSAALTLCLVLILRRPLTLAAFDPGFAQATGHDLNRIDLATMGIVLCITVVGLKTVGLILIVAMLIIPPVTARFWSQRVDHVVIISCLLGGAAGYVGAAISATAPNLPTGPIIVLVSFSFFAASLLLSPSRGVLSSLVQYRRFHRRVHVRQGLLALAHGQPILEPVTLRLLKRAGLVRADGVATDDGRGRAAKALLDEKRWDIVRGDLAFATAADRYDGLTAIESVLTADQIADVDTRIGAPKVVE